MENEQDVGGERVGGGYERRKKGSLSVSEIIPEGNTQYFNLFRPELIW